MFKITFNTQLIGRIIQLERDREERLTGLFKDIKKVQMPLFSLYVFFLKKKLFSMIDIFKEYILGLPGGPVVNTLPANEEARFHSWLKMNPTCLTAKNTKQKTQEIL